MRHAEQYLDLFDNKRGLPWHWVSALAADAGLRIEPTANYPLHRWIDFVVRHGPVMVNVAPVDSPNHMTHAVVLAGIEVDEDNAEVHYADPAAPALALVIEPFEAFILDFEETIKRTGFAYPQILHW